MSTITTINPYNQQELAQYPIQSFDTIQKTIGDAHVYQKEWTMKSIPERAAVLRRWTEILTEHKQELAELAALEMGKPVAQGIAELEKCIKTIHYYCDNSEQLLQPEMVATEAQKSYIYYSPLGVVLGVMPWNFPFWQVFRAFAPIVMSGNTFVLKHASQVTGCAVRLQELWTTDPSLPQGLFQVIVAPGSQMDNIIAHPQIAAVTFTGSTDVGGHIASVAGQHFKKHLLELGGSDAYIILPDADITLAAQKCAQSRLNNTGQSCIAAKRLIVHKDIADDFTKQLKDIFEKKTYGDPLIPGQNLGPMSRQDLRDEMHQQITQTLDAGAILVTGGFIPEGDHALYPPTIVSHIEKGMPMYDQEIFGPAVSIIIVDSEEEAIRIANDTDFGLGGGIFSQDIAKAEKIATQFLHTGSIAINDFVSSDPRLPFGGVNKSGYGRELSKFGMLEFCNIKTIYIK